MNTQRNDPRDTHESEEPRRAAHVPDEARIDVAERPGDTKVDHQHADELADEWGDESFPGSDPPAHY